MNITQIISEFLSHRFPGWGACHLNVEPCQGTLYLFFRIPGRYAALLKDVDKIAHLDIGIKRFVVKFPGHSDLVIDTTWNVTNREK